MKKRYTVWKKSGTEDYILYNSIYITFWNRWKYRAQINSGQRDAKKFLWMVDFIIIMVVLYKYMYLWKFTELYG